MENENLLDPDNVTDLFCLHYVFRPLIQQSLDRLREAWSRHRSRQKEGGPLYR